MKDKHPSSQNNDVQTGTKAVSTAVSPVSGSLEQRSRKLNGAEPERRVRVFVTICEGEKQQARR